nr:hypothetical protein GCM10020093_074900 [Planobispora longispora]
MTYGRTGPGGAVEPGSVVAPADEGVPAGDVAVDARIECDVDLVAVAVAVAAPLVAVLRTAGEDDGAAAAPLELDHSPEGEHPHLLERGAPPVVPVGAFAGGDPAESGLLQAFGRLEVAEPYGMLGRRGALRDERGRGQRQEQDPGGESSAGSGGSSQCAEAYPHRPSSVADRPSAERSNATGETRRLLRAPDFYPVMPITVRRDDLTGP